MTENFENCNRLVAVGDLHGDWDHAIRILTAARLVGKNGEPQNKHDERNPKFYKWVGDYTDCLVQMGDIGDRGVYSKQLYDLFERLREESEGRVVTLLGDHELMNLLQGQENQYTVPEEYQYWGKDYENGTEEIRTEAWSGEFGKNMIENYKTIFQFQKTVFVHAGLEEFYATIDAETINDQMRTLLSEQRKTGQEAISMPNGYLADVDGPLWTRLIPLLKDDPVAEKRECEKVDLGNTSNLRGTSAGHYDRIVVGHTPTETGDIVTRCDGRFVQIDTHISENGFPYCWKPTPGAAPHHHWCKAGLAFFELIGNVGFKNDVTAEGDIHVVRVQIEENADVKSSYSTVHKHEYAAV